MEKKMIKLKPNLTRKQIAWFAAKALFLGGSFAVFAYYGL